MTESTAGFGSGSVGVASPVASSSWVLFTCLFFYLYWLVYCFLFLLIRLPHFLVGYSFGTVDLGIVVSNIREYISSHEGFRFVMQKYYFGASSRSDLPDVLANSYLDTTNFDRLPQSLSFKCREIWKKKGYSHSDCPFCVRVAFDRLVGGYVVKSCRYSHIGYIVNLSSIIGHVRFEADLSLEERSHLANFGKIGYSGLQSKTAL